MARQPDDETAVLPRSALAALVVRAHGVVTRRLGRELYSTPAWDMLTDLYARDHFAPMQVTSLCGATAAPIRTAQRAVERLVDHGFLIRSAHPHDRRLSMVSLSPKAVAELDGFFEELWKLIQKVSTPTDPAKISD
jgi:DNA-binding MarR family transcriptional regulator